MHVSNLASHLGYLKFPLKRLSGDHPFEVVLGFFALEVDEVIEMQVVLLAGLGAGGSKWGGGLALAFPLVLGKGAVGLVFVFKLDIVFIGSGDGGNDGLLGICSSATGLAVVCAGGRVSEGGGTSSLL